MVRGDAITDERVRKELQLPPVAADALAAMRSWAMEERAHLRPETGAGDLCCGVVYDRCMRPAPQGRED